MSRAIKWLAVCALAAGGVAGLVFFSACTTTSSTAGGSGRLNVLVTDSTTDDWQQIQVQLKSISLRKSDDQSWVQVWTADPSTPTLLNLVDLSGVAKILATISSVPAASYDRLELVINTDPSTMTLVDDQGNTIAASNISVVDPSGKGEIKVDISPPITLPDAGVANLQIDFDLAHPLSIVVLNGKVVINLQIRHKAVPRNLKDIQFARTIGYVTDYDATNKTSFTVTPIDAGSALTFGVDANTIYYDVDAGASGNFDGLAALKDTTMTSGKGALVASNMNSDGSLYARRVWYGTLTNLPQFTPEGLVRRVGDNWIKVLNKNAQTTSTSRYSCHWDSDIIYVNDATIWTFHDTISMGTGTSVLKFIRRGFRVSVEYVDATAAVKTAKSINVQSAHDEGNIRSVTTTGITFGGADYCSGWRPDMLPSFGMTYSHEWPYSTVTDHAFSWWFFGLPSSASTNVQDLIDTVNQAKTANLRVFAQVELYWDTTANSGTGDWVIENCVLAPEKLREPTRITTNYSSSTGTMGVSTFDWDDDSLPMTLTVTLDKTGDLQTVVGSLRWNSTTRILTTTIPVLPDQWESLLTTSLFAVKVWVRPVKGTDGTFTWHAYTVFAFQIVS